MAFARGDTWPPGPSGPFEPKEEATIAGTAEASRTTAERDLTIRPFEGPGERWDLVVERAPDATFCHLWQWRALMEDVLGHRSLYLLAENREGKGEGVLPLVQVRSRLTGHYLVSLPFLNYGGPIGSAAAQSALAERARMEAESTGADLLELRARHRPPTSLRTNARKLTVLLELPSDPDMLWNDGFSSKLRNQIRRPLKEGMEIRIGGAEVESFYSVFARCMRDLGTPVLPRRFFTELPTRFGERVLFATVYWNERPLAAGCGFRWRGEFELTWAAFLREHRRKAPNMLLYWGLMKRLMEEGVSCFNFGRCDPESGTHRFKRQWGGEDVPLPWLQWSRGGASATPNHDRPILRLASNVWRRLPVGLANRLGPFFSRRLP